jgi:hypothetical protein
MRTAATPHCPKVTTSCWNPPKVTWAEPRQPNGTCLGGTIETATGFATAFPILGLG